MWLPQGVPWDVVAVIEGAMLPIASYGGHWIIERYKSGANGREARRVLESLRRGRTYLVFSGKDRANWDWETSSQIRKRLESGKIDAQEARCDSVADIWRYSKDETLANLIVLGSPIRLPLAEDFLKHLMTEGMLDGLSLRVTDARSTSDYVVKLT